MRDMEGMLGLVLSGGGARGAYEAGVLRFVYGALAERAGKPMAPEVICGTSIGALNGAWVGALGSQGANNLSYFWQTLAPEHVYRFSARDLWATPGKLLRRRTAISEGAALFDPAPLYEHVQQALPWDALHGRIDRGELRSFVVSVTDIATGRCIQFVDGGDHHRTTATMLMRPTRIGPAHVLASAAIPFVFPSVHIDDRYYVDGSLRQNTPLSPAIRLGVDRALVIGVKWRRTGDGVPAGPPIAPTPTFLAGKALNALMLDPVEDDLRRVDRMTELLEWAEGAYPGFQARMAAEHHPYRPIHSVLLHPSEDIGRIAAAAFPKCQADIPSATRILLRTIAAGENAEESDLMSYLLFHRAFTGELEALGYADAEKREEALATLIWGP
jgi:NTE family protein